MGKNEEIPKPDWLVTKNLRVDRRKGNWTKSCRGLKYNRCEVWCVERFPCRFYVSVTGRFVSHLEIVQSMVGNSLSLAVNDSSRKAQVHLAWQSKNDVSEMCLSYDIHFIRWFRVPKNCLVLAKNLVERLPMKHVEIYTCLVVFRHQAVQYWTIFRTSLLDVFSCKIV